MTSLIGTIGALFLKDEATATLPDVQAYLTYLNQNGIAFGGAGMALKALTAVEPGVATGFNQFIKDASALLLAHITAPSTAAAPTATAAKT